MTARNPAASLCSCGRHAPDPQCPVHPCPRGDDCALNSGAVHCKHCGRDWPPDETWSKPTPVRVEDAQPPEGSVS